MFTRIAKSILLTCTVLFLGFSPLAVTFSPAKGVVFQTNTASAQYNSDNEAQLASKYALPQCFNLAEGFSVTGCVGQLLYFAAWQPTHWLAARTAGFMDYFIFFSINASTYRGVPIQIDGEPPTSFIQEGWEIVRDISNILFIFGLIYIAFAFVFGLNIGGPNPKKLLIYVLVMALLINFSLFFSRIIADAGNILARTLYNQIELVARGNSASDLSGPDGVKNVGLMIISLANPQALIAPAEGPSIRNAEQEDNIFVLTLIGSIFFNIALIYIFIAIGVYFVARVVGLYFSMIFSPFAFASLAVPKLRSTSFIGFDSWIKGIVNYSFMAPLFIFFLYLTIKFTSLGIPINPNVAGGTDLSQLFLQIALPFVLVIAFLLIGKKKAQDMSGDIGKMVSNAASTGLKYTAGAAALTTAAVGVGAVAAGTKIARATGVTESLQKARESGKGRYRLLGRNVDFAKMAQQAGGRLQRATFDPRNTQAVSVANSIIKGTASAAGDKAPDIASGPRLKNKTFADRREAAEERQKKARERELRDTQMSAVESERRDEEVGAWNAKLNAEERRKFEAARAKSEKALMESDAYTNQKTELDKNLLLTRWRESFKKDYAKGMVHGTNSADYVYAGKGKVEVVGKDNASTHSRDLVAQLQASAAYTSAKPKKQEKMLEQLLAQQAQAARNGEYYRSVNATTGALENRALISAAAPGLQEDLNQLSTMADPSQWYKRRTSSELKESMATMEAAEQVTKAERRKGSGSFGSANLKDEEMGRNTLRQQAKNRGQEQKNARLQEQLKDELSDLNDTLGRYLDMSSADIARDDVDTLIASPVNPDAAKQLDDPVRLSAARQKITQVMEKIEVELENLEDERQVLTETAKREAEAARAAGGPARMTAATRLELSRINAKRQKIRREFNTLKEGIKNRNSLNERIKRLND